MTSAQWRLSGQITDLLSREIALTDRQLAERLNVTAAELRPVVGMLLGTRWIDHCRDYLVLPSPGGSREVSAA